jgi:hypothetical protein
VQPGDTVRVIGTFKKENSFHLLIDDEQPDETEEMIK